MQQDNWEVFLGNFFKKVWWESFVTLFLPSNNGKWSVGQGVKTPPFHGGITGSIPVRSTSFKAL
jgi:hypothetical protein